VSSPLLANVYLHRLDRAWQTREHGVLVWPCASCWPPFRPMMVKTIGDTLMLRTGDAAAAIRLDLCIVHDVGAQHGFPLVRVGMHTGSAVERDGDWFGATVNLAARVSATAAGGEALLTAATKIAAGDVEGVELCERGRRKFRNVGEPVLVYAAVRQGHTARPGCRLIRCAGWRSTPGMAWAGSPTGAWSTASARSSAPAPSPSTPVGTQPTIASSGASWDAPAWHCALGRGEPAGASGLPWTRSNARWRPNCGG